MLHDLRRHLRFLICFAGGTALALALPGLTPVDRLLVFSVAFCLAYLLLTALLARGMTAERLRGRADLDDEGMLLIAPMAIGSVALSLAAILMTIRDPQDGLVLRPALALVSVPLGWAMVHTVMAFHYAGLWYARGPDGREQRGLGFPGIGPGDEAGVWDFVYYSFTIGMAAQTADVTTLDTRMRRVTVVHSAFSFFYNAVIVALAVNAGVALG